MKKFNPKVTIVIPVYNGSNYMKEAINSALNQTYKNIEIIVINDGSKDNTEEIALSYGKKIRYFKKENGGVASALNLAIKKMKGEYFSWLSHDDVYYPDKIEKQINLLSTLKNKNTILYSNYSFINKKSKPIFSPVVHNHKMLTEKPIYSIYRGCINGITLLISKKCFDICGDFNENLRCTQDYDMWLRMIKKFDFLHMEDVLAKTRLHGKQDTNKNPKAVIEGNELWINAINSVNDNQKIKLEGTIYNFLYEMAIFLENTPYTDAYKYAKMEMQKAEENIDNEISNIKISVIIPFFNRSKIVIRAIKSVLSQTHNNIELILVDDGSTEDVSKVVELAKKNDVIKYIRIPKNKGVSHARNTGIKESTGSYISFLDSDDEFEKDKIVTQLREMYLRGYIFSHTSYNKKDENDNSVTFMNSGLLTGEVIPNVIYSCGIATPTVMIYRNYLIENNIFYNEELEIGEDVCFYLDILKGAKVLGIEKPLTNVYTNKKSAAYNIEKQLIGIKNILSYVISDPFYNKYHYEVALLSSTYINLVNDLYKKNDNNYQKIIVGNSKIQTITQKFSLVYKSLKKNGLLETTRKIKRKLKSKFNI